VSTVSQLAALVTALIHVQIFVMESVLWTRPAVHRRFGVRSEAEAATTRPLMINQGFYNLFLAVGILVGLALVHTGPESAGRAIVIFCCASIVGAALVLLASNRALARAALVQGVPPAVALLALAL
jgi:putative membrane protein